MHGLGLVWERSKSHYYVANQWLPCYSRCQTLILGSGLLCEERIAS